MSDSTTYVLWKEVAEKLNVNPTPQENLEIMEYLDDITLKGAEKSVTELLNVVLDLAWRDESEKESLEIELCSLQSQVDDLEWQLDVAQSEIAHLEETVSDLESRIEELESDQE